MSVLKKIQGLTYIKETFPVVSVIVALALSKLFDSDATTLFFFLLLLLTYLHLKYNPKILAGIALVCIALCPFFIITGNEGFTEKMAIYAYYLLVIILVKQIDKFNHSRDKTENYINGL